MDKTDRKYLVYKYSKLGLHRTRVQRILGYIEYFGINDLFLPNRPSIIVR